MKKLISMLLTLAMLLSLAVPVLGEEANAPARNGSIPGSTGLSKDGMRSVSKMILLQPSTANGLRL